MAKLTNVEYYEFAQKVDNEGFFYYMAHYGPDWDVIKKLGFKKKEVKAAIDLLKDLESKSFAGLEVELTEEELNGL